MEPAQDAVDFLLQGDPAIRWQTMRDLLDAPVAEFQKERTRVGEVGWGRRLLDVQDAAGTWAGAIYSPKWISTTYTLLLLRHLGLSPRHPAALRGCEQIWDGKGVSGGVVLPSSTSAADLCVAGMFVALAAYFGYEDDQIDGVIDWMVAQQLPDGGWNCRTLRSGSNHGSYHTSISVLEALAELADNGRDDASLDEAAERGREFFLTHRLFKSHRTGEISHPAFTKLSFPPRWHYDVLRGLDYFQSVAAPWDDRLEDAIDLLDGKQRKDGLWPVQNKHSGRVWFDMETGRQPSRWNTLRALRVRRWLARVNG
jgi:hypothetical protein